MDGYDDALLRLSRFSLCNLMGHANVDTTLNVYTQVLDGSRRAAVDKVGSELFTIVLKTEGLEARPS